MHKTWLDLLNFVSILTGIYALIISSKVVLPRGEATFVYDYTPVFIVSTCITTIRNKNDFV